MANNVTLPKRTTIGGMPHKLAYITPQEGDLLKRMGGSGEMHKGVPSYRPAGDTGATAAGSSSSSAAGNAGNMGGAAQGLASAVAAAAQGIGNIGVSGGDGRGLAADIAANQAFQNAVQTIAAAEAESGTTSQNVQAANFANSFPFVNITPQQVQNIVTDANGNIVSVTHAPSTPMGLMGLIADAFGVEQSVTTGYNTGTTSSAGSQYGRGDIPSQRVVPPVVDVTGQARCPTGYVFNESLQACILDTSATSPIGQVTAPFAPVPTNGYYSRQGLLDEPPSGLLEAGFGSPQDFAAANTAFRRRAATRPDIFTDPYNLQGYTLLS